MTLLRSDAAHDPFDPLDVIGRPAGNPLRQLLAELRQLLGAEAGRERSAKRKRLAAGRPWHRPISRLCKNFGDLGRRILAVSRLIRRLCSPPPMNSLVNSVGLRGLQILEPEPCRSRVPTCFEGWSGKPGSNRRHPPWQDGSVDRRPPGRAGDDRPIGVSQRVARWHRPSPVVVWVMNELFVNSP